MWSLGIDPSGRYAISCGADNQLVVWQDHTEEAEREAIEKQQQEAAQALAIESLSRDGKTLEAMTLAVRLRRPHQTRQLLQKSFEQCAFADRDDDLTRTTQTDGIAQALAQRRQAERIGIVSPAQLQDWLRELDPSELAILFEFMVKWNANGQTSGLANALMECVIRSIPYVVPVYVYLPSSLGQVNCSESRGSPAWHVPLLRIAHAMLRVLERFCSAPLCST